MAGNADSVKQWTDDLIRWARWRFSILLALAVLALAVLVGGLVT